MANPNGVIQQSMHAARQESPFPEGQNPRINVTSTVGSNIQRNSIMQGSVRGLLSRHEGPIQHTPRGVAAALVKNKNHIF